MCGRFALTASPGEVAAAAGLECLEDFPPRYNIAPTQPVLLIVNGPSGRREAMLARWGLVPSWVGDPARFSLLINARAETAADKPSFRNALNHRRALVPASGYYEWRRPAGGAKGGMPAQPFWIRPRDQGIVFFAALMETWSSKDGSEIDTAAILTAGASADTAPVADRMPVVIEPGHFGRWLDCRDFRPADIAGLLVPPGAGRFEAVPVSDKVNAIANTGPDIQEPAGPPIIVLEEMAGKAGKCTGNPDSRGEQLNLF